MVTIAGHSTMSECKLLEACVITSGWFVDDTELRSHSLDERSKLKEAHCFTRKHAFAHDARSAAGADKMLKPVILILLSTNVLASISHVLHC